MGPQGLTIESKHEPQTSVDDVEHPLRQWLADAAAHGVRLDKVLATAVPEYSRSHLHALIELGHVQVDGHVAISASKKVRAGQALSVELVPTAQSQAFRAEPIRLTIVHEDADLLVLNKAVGMVVHPAAGHWSGTVLNGLLAHHPGAASLPRAGIVHRLDKDTSGLMVVAKTLVAMTGLVRAIAARQVSREYLALARGVPSAAQFSVDAPLARDPVSRVKMAVHFTGKPARTDVQVVAINGAYCALRCKLHTGRTHQIRVHLMSVRMPLVADVLYGGAVALGMRRQALHATRLGFAHPVHGQVLAFEAAPPDDFAAAWAQVAG